MDRWLKIGRGPAALVLLAAIGGWSTVAEVRAEESGAPPPPSASRVTESFEEVRKIGGPERIARLDELAGAVQRLLEVDAIRERRGALRFLLAEIRAESGRYPEALEGYRQAEKDLEKTPFADDAEFARIRTLEAAGRDLEARESWERWESRHRDSPLLVEVRLARAWNAIRAEQPAAASRLLDDLKRTHPWFERDRRVGLARATVAYLTGEPRQALVTLEALPATPSTTYLMALCHLETGAVLRAAAAFQETAERWPHSRLRDPALLAKANTFLIAGDHRSAGEEFARVAQTVTEPTLMAEAKLRGAACLQLEGRSTEAIDALREIVQQYPRTGVASRAQFLVGEALREQGRCEEAIPEFNRVLADYFEHSVAASAQFRIGRCLDAMGRKAEATAAYQAVVAGYPLEPESPAAAYLAGVGMMDQGRALAAAPYLQLVLDRYAARSDSSGAPVFASEQHRELVEAALCMLELSYHRAGDLGKLSGAPHVLLHRMPPSRSPWRAYALLIDADASAAQGRYVETQRTLERLFTDFPDHPVGASAGKLLAWTYAKQGMDSLAIQTEERLIARYGAGNEEIVSSALLDVAHVRFNQKRYAESADAYEEFARRFPGHPKRFVALYQSGLCYLRLDRAGDAVDRWETIVREAPDATVAERAWARAGDAYFQAERYEDAKRCYRGLVDHFGHSSAAAVATLRIAQSDYNSGRDAEALEGFSQTIEHFPGTPVAREAARGTELALYRLGQQKEGARVLEQLVERYPNSGFAADALFQIAWKHYQAERYAEAAEGFRQVIRNYPGYANADRAHFLTADAYARSGARDEARSAYDQFLSFFPQSSLRPTVQFRLALLRFEQKEYLRAAIGFTAVLAETASSEIRSASRYNLALCRRVLGDAEEARAELERYRKDFAGDERAAEVAYQLGDLHEVQDRIGEALAEYRGALASHPGAELAVELHFRIGRCHERQGDAESALEAYRKAAGTADKNDPFRLSALARSAALYEAKRDYRRAVAAYRDIIRHAEDPELVALATGRVNELQAGANVR